MLEISRFTCYRTKHNTPKRLIDVTTYLNHSSFHTTDCQSLFLNHFDCCQVLDLKETTYRTSHTKPIYTSNLPHIGLHLLLYFIVSCALCWFRALLAHCWHNYKNSYATWLVTFSLPDQSAPSSLPRFLAFYHISRSSHNMIKLFKRMKYYDLSCKWIKNYQNPELITFKIYFLNKNYRLHKSYLPFKPLSTSKWFHRPEK